MVVSLVAVQGCKVGPDYVEPEVEATDEWFTAVEAEMSAQEPDIEKWWESLGDSTLTELIKGAELSNLDLRIAVSRVAETRALRGIAKGDLYPDLVLEGAYSYTKLSDNSVVGQIITGGTDGEVEPFELWEASAGSFWEIDLFGRIRRGVEAATAQFEATIEDYRDVLVSLYAEVALNYVDVRALQMRLNFARQNVTAQRESLELTRDRFEAGLTSALDVAQAEQNLAQTESSIPTLETGLNAALTRLAVLLGTQPGSLHGQLMSDGGDIPVAPDDIMVGVPADVLRRRPDVRRAELHGNVRRRWVEYRVGSHSRFPLGSVQGREDSQQHPRPRSPNGSGTVGIPADDSSRLRGSRRCHRGLRPRACSSWAPSRSGGR
jgi:NodT family efflux transporter outer membrane factor (OMF) lipoprotein